MLRSGLTSLALVICGVVLTPAILENLCAANWPRFRGPNGFGVAETEGLPVNFGPEKNVLWKTALPAGHSSPVLSERQIFVTAFEKGQLYTICVDRQSGKLLWHRRAPRPREESFHRNNGPATPSPVTDGKNVYVFFGDYGLLSYGPDGEERWRRPLGPFSTPNGHGTSPILVDGMVILMSDQDRSSFLLALDQKDGSVHWKTERPEVVHGYSTPVLYQPGGGPAQILTPSSYQLISYSAETGEKLWSSRGLTWQIKSSAIVDGGTIYAAGAAPGADAGERQILPAYEDAVRKGDANGDKKISEQEAIDNGWRHGGGWGLVDLDGDGLLDQRDWEFFRARRSAHNTTLAIRPPKGARGDVTEKAVLWKYEKAVPVVSSPLLYRGVLYTIKDGGILTAFDPETGKVLKQGRLKGAVDTYFSSPVAADGKIYVISQAGKVSVVKPGADWETLAVNDLGEECFTTPAIGDGTLYIRTVSALYAFGAQLAR